MWVSFLWKWSCRERLLSLLSTVLIGSLFTCTPDTAVHTQTQHTPTTRSSKHLLLHKTVRRNEQLFADKYRNVVIRFIRSKVKQRASLKIQAGKKTHLHQNTPDQWDRWNYQSKQECIPVGYVPPAAVAVRGSPPCTPPPGTMHPPRTMYLPGPCTPSVPCPPRYHAHPPVDRHTPVNILPCPKLRLRAVTNIGHQS